MNWGNDVADGYRDSARMAEKMAASGQSLNAATNTSNAIGARNPSIATVIDAAKVADEAVGQRVKSLFALVERAETIATTLAGPYPSRGQSEGRGDTSKEASPSSAFAAMQVSVDRVTSRAVSADPALARLSAALEQIERVIG